MNKIIKPFASQILPLLTGTQMINNYDIIDTVVVQFFQHTGADESRPSGESNHINSISLIQYLFEIINKSLNCLC